MHHVAQCIAKATLPERERALQLQVAIDEMDTHAAVAAATKHVVAVVTELREELRPLVNRCKQVEVNIRGIVRIAFLPVLRQCDRRIMVNKGDKAILLGITLSAYVQVELRAIVSLGMRYEVDLLLIAEQTCIAGGIDLAVERSRTAVLQVKNHSLIGIHTDIVVEIPEVVMLHYPIQTNRMFLAVVHRVMRETDRSAIHEHRVVHIVRHTGERHDHTYAIRLGFSSNPREFLASEDMHMPRTATSNILEERACPMIEESQIERVGIDMQAPGLVVHRRDKPC